jgi:DNA-binding transcriptional LysR family regulator
MTAILPQRGRRTNTGLPQPSLKGTHEIRPDRHALRARVRLRGFEAICAMVEAGVGVAIVPEPAARRCAQTMQIGVMELMDGWALRQLAICVRSFDALPRHAQQLVDALRA